MKTPHPIPYQGSKRNITRYILAFFPQEIGTLIEPFAGSAAVSIAAACYGKAARFHLNDLNQPLTALWREIVDNPKIISENYRRLWEQQQGHERQFYDFVRDEFNQTKRPEYLLYLLARCVKASVRYNAKGEFNQSWAEITTEEISNYGYEHPPRAARDVREAGVPLETFRARSSDGRSIAAYRFGNLSQVRQAR